MEKLVVKNGQLYNEHGEKQALEFGNPDQIKVIKEYANLNNAFLNDGLKLDIDFTVTASTSFKCTCGEKLSVEEEVTDKDDLDELHEHLVTCFYCKEQYELSINDVCDLVAKKVTSHD